ncbi:Transcriptional regulatory protein WalR [Acetobacterium wieringae]|uniref:Stage 0 sporulation protein A homolog n=1 Tax=Acetobacterium wieringae TaxID=52694 RepID=A0A5D0WU60_9FIRM|nr:response regulator transcription factor [Acetobacterium wieringae]TYC87677.1 response regulator transcription factor [Acetobacterium wieringae]VUZ22799.1 Transcriptional regulatory protein WalR [Acetobacterium wieringae]
MNWDCLIVDDEVELAKATCEYFEMFGLSCAVVTNSDDCVMFMENNQVKLILLDINLGNDSGFELCKALRKNTDVPILFISARQSDDDVLIALNIGGDDYIKKPYSLSVLLAKVKVIIKRYDSAAPKAGSSDAVSTQSDGPDRCGNLRIDKDAMKVYRNEEDVGFKTKEFKLFLYLYENKNRVIAKDELFAKIWGDAFFSDGTLNVHIRKIREKIEENPNQPQLIKTIWGIGYMFETQENQ